MALPDRTHDKALQFGPFCGYHGPQRSPDVIDWVVIHDTEGSSSGYPTQPSAQGVASYGASKSAKASWHVTCDDKLAIRTLGDNTIGYHAYSPANNIGLGLEICGFARWSKIQWYLHQATLKRAAWVTARWCVKYGIPARWLTDSEIRAQKPGLLTHADVTRALKLGSHTDPGPNFPRYYFLMLVKRRVRWLTAEAV